MSRSETIERRQSGQNKWTFLGRLRIALILISTFPLVGLQALMLIFAPHALWWPVVGLWHRVIVRIMGVKVHITGTQSMGGPVLFVSNHISWLDIPILGGFVKNASFVAKHEVSTWGLAGKLAALHKTLYVKRERRSDSARQRDELASRMIDGDSLILFPEGTTKLGMRTTHFKSALFSVAERADALSDHALKIQPVTLSYTEINDMPMVRASKPMVAWLGDIDLLPHLRHLIGVKKLGVTIEFHEPVTFEEFGCRKSLAKHCEAIVQQGLERAHRAEHRVGEQKAPPIDSSQSKQDS